MFKKVIAGLTAFALPMVGLTVVAPAANALSMGCSVAGQITGTNTLGLDIAIPFEAGETVTVEVTNLTNFSGDVTFELIGIGLFSFETAASSDEAPFDALTLTATLPMDAPNGISVTQENFGGTALGDFAVSCSAPSAPTAQTITFDAFTETVTTVQSPVLLTASASSGLPVTYSTTTPSVCAPYDSPSPAGVILYTEGTCTITASQVGGLKDGVTYEAAADVTRDLTVTKTPQDIEFSTVSDQLLSAGTVEVAAVANVTTPSGTTQLGPVDSFTSLTTSVCSAAPGRLAALWDVTLLAVGTCTIQADRAGTAQFLAASDTISFTISDAVSPPVDGGSQNLPAGLVGFSYSTSITASGGAAPFYWSIVSGTLPAGLSLNAGNGVISGTPTTEETQTVTIRITDSRPASQGGAQRVQVAYTLAILEELVITTPALEPAVLGQAYSQTLQAEGGDGNYTWTIDSGALPAGLSLSTSGVISGTPTELSTNTFTIRVTDGSGVSGTRNLPTVVASSTDTTIAPIQTRSGSVSRTTGSYDINLDGTCVSGDCSAGSGSGGGTYSFTDPGVYVLVITTTDSSGLTTVETYTITVLAPDGSVPLEEVTDPTPETPTTPITDAYPNPEGSPSPDDSSGSNNGEVEQPVVNPPTTRPGSPVNGSPAVSDVRAVDLCARDTGVIRYTWSVINPTGRALDADVTFTVTDQTIRDATSATINEERTEAVWEGLRLKAGQSAPLMARTLSTSCASTPAPTIATALASDGTELEVKTVRWRQMPKTGKWRVVPKNRELWRQMPDGVFFSVVKSPRKPQSKNLPEAKEFAGKLTERYDSVYGGVVKGKKWRNRARIIAAWVAPV